jgi:hypothetical protein
MKKQTALQQFIEWGNQMIGDYPAKTLSFYEAIDKAEELLSVEKEQIIKADLAGVERTLLKLNEYIPVQNTLKTVRNIKEGKDTHDEGEQYYNETYNTNTP